VKASYKKEQYEIVGDLSTAGPTKLDIKVKKLKQLPGVTFQVVGDTAPAFPGQSDSKYFIASTVKFGVEYQRDFFAGNASAETPFTGDTHVFTGAGVIGFEGLSVGGEVKYNTNKSKDIEDYNVGAQYDDKDFTATLKTAKLGNDLTGSYIHKVNGDLSVGGQFNTKLDGTDDRSAGVASEYKVDANTTVKLRGNTKKVAAVALEHRLANPRLALGFASSWNLVGFSAPTPKDFGISLVFGDHDAK